MLWENSLTLEIRANMEIEHTREVPLFPKTKNPHLHPTANSIVACM